MSFTPHQVRQLLDNLDRIATALERLADYHQPPAPSTQSVLPRSVRATNKSDFQF